MKKTIAYVLVIMLTVYRAFGNDFNISHVKVFNKFLKNGSTARIRTAFSSPKENNIDTSTSILVIAAEDLHDVLKKAVVKKHFQKKLGGITLGGEFVENNRTHFFVYIESSRLLIDFTENINYWLTDKIIVQSRKE